MKKHTFRALLLPALWLIGVSAAAQVRPANPSAANRINPANNRINPAMNRIVVPQSQPTVITPVTPGYIPPVAPVYPGTLPPGAIITTPSYLVPTYPSGWVGPTIIRETHSEPAPSAVPHTGTTSPALRLVALLGSLKHLDAATGADLGLTEARLGISVGMMVGYAQTKTVRASGDFFGVPWDGPGYFPHSEDSKGGEFLDHPIMTANEFSPGPWEFEAGVAGHSVDWMRLAVALFEDESHDPNARQPNLPRGRRAAMREVLLRIRWADKGVATPSPGTSGADALAGGDVTYFGKSLATFGEKTMTPSLDNRRIGIAEWYVPTQDMGKVLEGCPRFMETPDGAQLREARASAGNTPPPWAWPFEFRSDRDRYAGELWFVVVPDAAVNQWLQRK
jgi:hypothetical protein